MSVQNDPPIPARRGRPRAYDPEQALDAATLAFWQAGFSATSLDALTAATGMNRPSLYGAFGDKRALYLAALQRYTDAGVAAMQAALNGPHPLPQALQRVYDTALKMYYPPRDTPRGCFLIGTAATESVTDDDVRTTLARSLKAFDAQFEQRLQRAVAEGELPKGTDTATLARLASAVLHTLALRSRAGDKRSELAATAAAGVALLCGSGANP